MSQPDWNRQIESLPASCDVLVVGAGPAGSATAMTLARHGHDVVLVDSCAFPRDKVCGDGLVPDAHAALRTLGLHEQVMRVARPFTAAQCVSPGGRSIEVPGELAVLPRKELDAMLCAAAVGAGARMFAPARFTRPIRNPAGRVVGAQLRHAGTARDIHCRWLVLATGAAAGPLVHAGMCERRTPSAMALRCYVRHPAAAAAPAPLRFVWHRDLRGGYGWVFPAGDGLFNVGVGLLDSHQETPAALRQTRRQGPNLRSLFDAFVSVDPLAARLMQEGERMGDLKGAPLRCDLAGARWAVPGMLVTGEAAGATYALTGEGIGKALETGIAAAHSIASAGDEPAPDDDRVMRDYHARLAALRPRFEMYRKASSFNHYPALVGLMIWRAQRSARAIDRLSDILNERRMPGSLLSWRGFKAMMWG